MGYNMAVTVQTEQKRRCMCYILSKTVLLVTTFLAWGLAVAVQWATLPDLRIRLDTTMHGLPYAMSIGAMGQICGGMFSVISDRYEKASDLFIAGMVFMASVAFVIIPFCSSLDMLGICFMVTHLGFYCTQASAHSQITALWGINAKPARYALHCGFSVGLALGYLLAHPFISGVRGHDWKPEPYVNESSYLEEHGDENMTTTVKYFEVVKSPWKDESSIEYAYIAVFSLSIVLAATFVVFFFYSWLSGTLNRLQKGEKEACWRRVLAPRKWADGDVCLGVAITFMLVVACVLQQLVTLGTHTLLASFAVDSHLGFDVHMATMLSFVVVAVGALSRGIGIACSPFVSIRHIIVIVVAGQTVFAFLSLVLAPRSAMALWILLPCLGFFREAVLPTLYAWADHYILIYGFLIGFSDLVSTLVSIFCLPLQNYLYKRVAINSIFYTTVGFSTTLLAFVIVMNLYVARKESRRARLYKVYHVDKETVVPVLEINPESSEIKEMKLTQI